MRDGRRLVYVLLSLDPNVRIDSFEIEHQLPEVYTSLLGVALADVGQCLRVGSKTRLEKVGSDLGSSLLPKSVTNALLDSDAQYLYLDLEDKLVSFPWECIRIGDSFVGTKFKVGRHIRVTDEGRGLLPTAKKRRFAIIANPDGSLRDASLEGELIRRQLQPLGDVDLLNASVTVNEACDVIATRELFHYAGHSTGTGLSFSDREMTASDVASLPSVPRLVFLNSCESGSLGSWSNACESVVRAFLQAGSKAVIAASTSIASKQAVDTAQKFYERFLADESLGHSLASASIHETDELGWARYVVFGHPEFKLKSNVDRKKTILSKKALAWPALAALFLLTIGAVVGWRFLAKSSTGLMEEEIVSEEACQQGEAARCYILGESLAKRERHKEAVYYFEKSCHQGNVQSCLALARSHLKVGNVAAARDLTQKYCIERDEPCVELAEDLLSYGASDFALKLHEKRCNRSDGLACAAASFIMRELGDLDGALVLNEKGCKLGFDLACVQAGSILTSTGRANAAVKLLSKFCTPHDGNGACVNLGAALMEQGKVKQALSAFRIGCKESVSSAAVDCEFAGAVLVDKHRSEALEFFKKGCDNGSPRACAKMSGMVSSERSPCADLASSDCYQLGYKFQKNGDLVRAESIYRYLCESGDVSRCNDFAVLLKMRDSLPEAKRVFREACDKNVGLSCSNLGNIAETDGLPSDALKLYIRGCDLGVGQSCTQAFSLLQKSDRQNEAADFLAIGCELNDAAGCNNFGFFKNGKNDKEGAKTAYKKACTLGLSLGCRNLAILLNELGGEEEAKTVLKKSCDRGDVLACDLLKSAGLAH